MTFVIPSCYLWVVLYLYRMRLFIYLYTTRSISLGCYQLWILGMCKTNKYITSTSICSCFKTLKKWWPPTLVWSSRSSCRSLNLSCQSWDVYKVEFPFHKWCKPFLCFHKWFTQVWNISWWSLALLHDNKEKHFIQTVTDKLS